MRILLALVLWLGCWSAAIAQSAQLRPGDVISISVYQDPKLDRQVLIGPTGMIAFPLVGQIKAAGIDAVRARKRAESETERQIRRRA